MFWPCRPSSTVYKIVLYPIDEGQHARIALVCSPGSCTALLHCEILLLTCMAVAIVCTCVCTPVCEYAYDTYVCMYVSGSAYSAFSIHQFSTGMLHHEAWSGLDCYLHLTTYSSAGSTARRQIGGWGNWTRTSNRPFKKQRQESGQRSVTKYPWQQDKVT